MKYRNSGQLRGEQHVHSPLAGGRVWPASWAARSIWCLGPGACRV